MAASEERLDRVKALFQDALELDEATRQVFLAEACAGDETLRAEVQDLLAALAQASGFLAEPQALAEERPGATIDRYRLLERIGEGGFGVVFRAEQFEPLRRDVALKILKRGMDSDRVVRRFDQERQALARMQHPNIAAVFDGGTTPSGRPYFVMEYVRGLPITRFCREAGLGIEERAALLQKVCQAVQHAHHKGLVHRDLKPANILVSTGDEGGAVPKVIDFGIAKALDTDDGSLLALTATACGQPIGTLEYMAPEQASGSSDIDSRADVYSLGVVLYELLTGRRPFERGDEESGQLADVLQRIRSETAVRPSARVQKAGETPLPGADRWRWSRRLRGDLDWIVVRALQKDPARRYPTAAALADDIERFLVGRPVEAGPPTTAYQLRCLIARHRVAFGAALLLLVSLLAGFLATTSALADARREATRKERTLLALKQLVLTADPALQKGPNYTVRQLLDDFGRGIGAAFDDDPVVACELHVTIGGAYRNLGEIAAAERHLTKGLQLVRGATGGRGPQFEQAMREWGHVLRDAGRYAEAEATFDELLRSERGAGPGGLRLVCLLAKADLRRLQGDHGTSERIATEALDLLDRGHGGGDPRGNRAAALDLLGSAASARGDHTDALQRYEEALALRRACYGEQSLILAISYTNLADAHRAMGDYERAEAPAREALRLQQAAFGERHPEVARTLSLLGDLALRRGDVDRAEGLYREAHGIRLERLPEGHAERATGHLDLARIASERKQHDVAEHELRQALELQRAAGSVHTHSHAAALQNLGVALAMQDRHEEAIACYQEAYELHLELGGEQKPPVADCLQNLALQELALGRAEAALALHERALALRERYRPDDLAAQLSSQFGIAAAARAAGDLARTARAETARAELLERSPGEHPQRVAAAQVRAGRAWLDAGDPAAATPLVEAVHAFCEQHLPGKWPLGEAKSLLAECRLGAGDLAAAEQLAAEGALLLAKSPVREKLDRAEATLRRIQAARATTPTNDR